MRCRVLCAAVCAVLLASCSGDVATDNAACRAGESVTVLAASSLSEALRSAEQQFVDADQCVDDVRFVFGSSAALAAQVVNGAPVDVFVSASTSTMQTVVDAAVAAGTPAVIARNAAALMVSSSAPAGAVTSLESLVDARSADLKVGLCAPSVPCGALADAVLANAARAYAEPHLERAQVADTEASSVEDLVTKIQLGELDAGITYVSDCTVALRSSSVSCVEIPSMHRGEAVNASTDLLAVQVSDTDAARRYVGFLAGSTMRNLLVNEFGFEAAT